MEFKSLVKTIWMTRILFSVFLEVREQGTVFFFFLHRNPLQKP